MTQNTTDQWIQPALFDVQPDGELTVNPDALPASIPKQSLKYIGRSHGGQWHAVANPTELTDPPSRSVCGTVGGINFTLDVSSPVAQEVLLARVLCNACAEKVVVL